VAVKIKLKRLGKIREPYYRIVVADSRTKRDGRAIEEIGKYHPKAEPSLIEVDSQRAQHWLSVGAQPTDPVRKILEITGDWQKFKGLPGTEGTLRTAEPKTDRKAVFAAAVAETLAGTEAKPKTRARSEPKASAKAEGKAEGKAEAKAESKSEAKAEGKAEKSPARTRKSEDAGEAAAPPAAEEPAAAEPAQDSAPEADGGS
jgi:small subunit ribosomal protein S16